MEISVQFSREIAAKGLSVIYVTTNHLPICCQIIMHNIILPPHLIDVLLSAGESSLCFELTSAYHGRSRTSTRASYFQAILPTHFLVPAQTKQPLQEGTSASLKERLYVEVIMSPEDLTDCSIYNMSTFVAREITPNIGWISIIKTIADLF